jgi:hypothetical protein
LSWVWEQAGALQDAYQQGHLAKLFGNWLVIGGLSLAIAFWAAVAAWRLNAGVRRFCRAIDDSTARLVSTPRKAREFAGSYESVAASLQDAAIVGLAWRDWSATVITPEAPGTPVRSTNRPNTYFSLDLLRYCRINPRLHAAMPNLLVGVGLLLTFAGLAIALSAAGGIADQSVSQADRQRELKSLLDVASAKFVTSLVGLLCSLAYTFFRGRELDRAERALDGFLAALEERIPLATPATLQAEANGLLDKLLTAQSQFGNDLAINIGGLLDNALDHRLGEHIGPLREAIENLSKGIGTQSEDTLRTLLEEFRSMLQGSAETHMEKLADALAKTSEGMEQIRAGLTDAANRMASAAGQISEQMGRNAEQAMAGITRQMEGLVGELRALAEQSRSAGNDAMAQAADRIARAGESFGGAAQAIATSLEQTVQGITTRLSGEAEAATRRMTEELTNATAAMRDLAERNRSAGDEAARAMAERIGQAAASFEQSAAKVAEALTSGAGDAAGRLTAAVEQLRDHFVKLTGELAGNLETAGSQFAQQGRDGATALAQAAEAAAAALRAGGQESDEALRTGGADASRGLQMAAGELAPPLRELGQRITALQNEALQLGRSLSAMQQAVSEVTTPLRAATADLVNQSASGRKTAADLASAAQRIAPLADAMNGAMLQLGEAERRLAALSQNLDTALGGFKGLDASLGRVFKDLGEGLTGFTRQVADFVKHTNDEMAKAVNTLSGAVTDLSDFHENSGPRKRTN